MPKSAVRERDIMDAIRLAMAPHARLFRNNNGMLKDRSGTPIRYGLGPGSADLVGWTCIDFGSARGAVLAMTAIEVKRPGGRLAESQRNFIDYIREFGGIGIVACDANECVAEHQRQVFAIRERMR